MPRWSLPILGVIFGLALLLGGLTWLNQVAREQMRDRERYGIAFEDIECTAPPGMSRLDFLGEVQYLGGMPSRLSLLDEGLLERLAAAFAKHPRVEKVERVEKSPARQVKVVLVFRPESAPQHR
jgi:hypothetical protein